MGIVKMIVLIIFIILIVIIAFFMAEALLSIPEALSP